MTKPRKSSLDFKAQVVQEIIGGAKTQARLARQHRIQPELIVRSRGSLGECSQFVCQRQQP